METTRGRRIALVTVFSCALAFTSACAQNKPTFVVPLAPKIEHQIVPTATPTRLPATSSVTKGDFTTTLTLDRTAVTAGASIKATLVIDNHTSGAVRLPCLVNGDMTMGLANSAVPSMFASGLVACQDSLPVGKSAYHETIRATYPTCSVDGPTDASSPRCDPGGAVPALPVGRYHTTISWFGMPKQIPQPTALLVDVVLPTS